MLAVTDLPNLFAWVLGVVPMGVFCWWAWTARGESWRPRVLLCGILLVMLAAWQAQLFIAVLTYIESLPAEKLQAGSVWLQLKSSGALWLALFPAVSGGIGVNLISTWLTTRRV